jgi:hypothetical protein
MLNCNITNIIRKYYSFEERHHADDALVLRDIFIEIKRVLSTKTVYDLNPIEIADLKRIINYAGEFLDTVEVYTPLELLQKNYFLSLFASIKRGLEEVEAPLKSIVYKISEAPKK